MRSGRVGYRQLLPAFALGLAVLALVAVVAVAADDLPLRGPRQPGADRWELTGVGDVLTVAVFAMALVGVVVLLVFGRGGGRRPAAAPRRSLSSQLMTFLLLVLLLWAVGRRGDPPERAGDAEERQPSRPVATATTAAPSPDDDPVAPRRSLTPAVGLVALAAVLLGAAALASRRRVEAPAEPDDAHGRAASAVGDAVEGLLGDPDPRRAIVAAYAALLAGLERAGTPRRASEAPEEYVARVLGALDVRAEPLRRLTALFAEARFSEHPVAEAHRAAALDALEAARADLRAGVPGLSDAAVAAVVPGGTA